MSYGTDVMISESVFDIIFEISNPKYSYLQIPIWMASEAMVA